MNFRLRPVHRDDIPAIQTLLHENHTGLTNVPETIDQLEAMVQLSIDSFAKDVSLPESELYCFVLEESDTREVIGISSIKATTGGDVPLYFFRREWLESTFHKPDIAHLIPILQPISYVRGPSEILGLFLAESSRGHGLGKLLSLGRFLFIASFPDRFTSTMCTELRGYIHENGTSPFWSGLGAHFTRLSFQEALGTLKKEGRSFLSRFLPRFPIYTELLPYSVQEVIGKTHLQTQSALSLLLGEGFIPTHEIDVLDGGPKLNAETAQIRTIAQSTTYTLSHNPCDEDSGPHFLVSNCTKDFRTTLSAVVVSDQDIQLPLSTQKLLEVLPGSAIRISPITSRRTLSPTP